MPKYVDSKEKLHDFIEYETAKYGKRRKIGDNLSESGILRKHIILLRKTEYHTNTGHKIRKIFYKYRLLKLQRKFSMHVPINVFDKGLVIMHTGPLLVNEKVVVGKNCCLHMNTAIVSSGHKEPVLGDGVWLGYGSVVLGGITIADNVVIGAGAVVNKSIEEPNIAVGGIPAKKISDKGRATRS